MAEQICHKADIMAIHDAMDILSGKWKISILSSMCYYSTRRFSDLLNDLEGISNKQLSKELKELEMNKLVKRTVLDTQPVTVHYNLTEYGWTLQDLIHDLAAWGTKHRRVIMDDQSTENPKLRIDAQASVPFFSASLRSENEFVDGSRKTSMTNYGLNGRRKEKDLLQKQH
jgi:DNA-binding HxlR family transcriptional regulator